MPSDFHSTGNNAVPQPMHVPQAGSATGVAAGVDWAELVRQIQANDPAGMETLHKVFSRGVRYYLARQIGTQDLEDRLHDIFLIVVRAIQRGELRDPERLMGFVRTVAKRNVAAQIESAVKSRSREADFDSTPELQSGGLNPEALALVREKAQIVQSALASLPPRDREILERFYLREQTPEQICADMKLTETQFRLMKSRAKARFGAVGQKKANPVRRALAAVSGRYG